MYFRVCPYCGASLDPGETCDCKEKPPPGVQDRGAADGINLYKLYHRKGDMSNGTNRLFSRLRDG